MPESLEFNLEEEDYYAVDIAMNTIRQLLKRPNIKPRQIIGLGNALYSLERLPEVTEGAWCEFGLVYRNGDDKFSEMKYINFLITDSEFEISEGGSVYDASVGSDTYPGSEWRFELDGYRCTDLQLYDIEDGVAKMLNLGARITVDDQSEIDYEFEDDDFE